jgi:radical SAM protein with 4Fe4S-binding SPASM domain
MKYETALDAAKFLIANAEEVNQTPSINFFGGEPMLMWDSIIVPLTNWVRQEYKKPFQLSMTTNGTLLNEERIKFMKDNNIGLLLSIDGAKETQDYNRPYHNDTKSSFDTLEKILPLVVENFSTTFRMTTIPPTCHHVFENIQFASSLGFRSFFVIPNEFEEWPEDKKLTLKNEITKYGDYYIECLRNGTQPITFSTFENAFRDIKNINNAISNNQYRVSQKCKACGKCGLGASRFASIHPNGNLYGCQEMTSNEGEKSIFYIGNIYTGVEEDRRTALMALYDNGTVVGTNCETCKYNRICDGGCVANNYLATGSVTHPPKMHCWWNQTILDEAIRVMQILGNEGNATFRKKWGSIK